MRDAAELEALLSGIDGRGYRSYREIEGDWAIADWVLRVDHVQGDPFAAPSRARALLPPGVAALPQSTRNGSSRTIGTAACIARTFAERAREASRSRGTGKSGEIRMAHPGQKTLRQTAVSVASDGSLEARFTVGLPAQGRRVAGRQAAELLLGDVPAVVRDALVGTAYGNATLEEHAATNEDADALRAALRERNLVAFIADGAHLPRRSGVDDRPLARDAAVPFRAPESMRVDVDLPNAGTVSGMGIGPGVTLIVGGGFHGKSTLLRALEAGVYNHRPGDGRELAVTHPDAAKIRAEDGRSVTGVDISGFIDDLPLGRDTHRFTSPNASGSTSQAAAIVESIEAGARLLLVDEDTSATNFMIRDRRMQELVPADGEPITPFVDRVRDLHDRHGVSSILVLGGSGDYLDVADRVIRMRDYHPEDVTDESRAVAARFPTGRRSDRSSPPEPPPVRLLAKDALDPSRGRREHYVRVPDDRTLLFGTGIIDLVAVEQLACRAQTRAVGQALAYLGGLLRRGPMSITDGLDAVEAAVASGGLDALSREPVGDLAEFRRHEVAAALNRLRGLRVE